MSNKKAVLLCACLLFALRATCPGSIPSKRTFLWDEANSIMASARSPEDYLVAAQVYRNMADKGIRNGPVFYNMGTAFLNAGAYENAIAAFLSAERYMGSCPDLANNLSLALAGAGKDKLQAQWYRIPLFWHFRISTPDRTLLAATAFCLFWICLALRKSGAGRRAGVAASFLLVLFVLLASSTAASLHQAAASQRFVPTLPPDISAAPRR